MREFVTGREYTGCAEGCQERRAHAAVEVFAVQDDAGRRVCSFSRGPPAVGYTRSSGARGFPPSLARSRDALSPSGRRRAVLRRSIIEVLRVSANSVPNKVAGAIAGVLRDASVVEVQAIGADAVNQAVKAIAIARSYIEENELDLVSVPSFVRLELHSEERTAIRFAVETRPLGEALIGGRR